MKMESIFIRELFLVVGLVRKKLHHGAYILYADRGAWDSFIQNFCLGMETTFFSIKNKKSLYIKVGEWSNTRHLSRTPGNIWKEASKRGFYDIPKLRISSAAIKLARNIGKQFTNTSLFSNHAAKQMRRFNGIGDLLEDDVEKMHQIAGN
jgi:hypothetical protein